jgi:L-rhamnose-H+ transport protein
MTEHFWLGMAIVFAGGIFNGFFAVPMKYSRRWKWENTWGWFMLLSTVAVPIILAGSFVPHLRQVYQELPWRALLPPLIFGFLWGTTQVTIGLSFQAVGVAMTFAIVCGTTALLGSLIPLVVLHPEDLFRPRGILLMVSIPIMLVGLWLYARAGSKREKEQAVPGAAGREPKMSFVKGLILCFYTGSIGTSINLGFAFGGKIASKSLSLGANPATSTYPVWLLVLWAGFIPSAVYCGYLLWRNRNWGLYIQAGAAREALLGVVMAVLWGTAIFGYGIGATLAGKYGTSVGYALWIALTISSATLAGLLTGEWKGTSSSTRKVLVAAMALVMTSVIILNLGGLF